MVGLGFILTVHDPYPWYGVGTVYGVDVPPGVYPEAPPALPPVVEPGVLPPGPFPPKPPPKISISPKNLT